MGEYLGGWVLVLNLHRLLGPLVLRVVAAVEAISVDFPPVGGQKWTMMKVFIKRNSLDVPIDFFFAFYIS